MLQSDKQWLLLQKQEVDIYLEIIDYDPFLIAKSPTKLPFSKKDSSVIIISSQIICV